LDDAETECKIRRMGQRSTLLLAGDLDSGKADETVTFGHVAISEDRTAAHAGESGLEAEPG
jgi:hypothetical protein